MCMMALGLLATVTTCVVSVYVYMVRATYGPPSICPDCKKWCISSFCDECDYKKEIRIEMESIKQKRKSHGVF